MNIFYSYSNHCSNSKKTYDNICEYYDNENNTNVIIDVDNENGTIKLLDGILKNIDSCDLFVCDITPEYKTPEEKYYINPNVMLELGYAMKVLEFDNILLLLNGELENIPSMLKGLNIKQYDITLDEYYLEIIDKINYFKQNQDNDKEWCNFNYNLSDSFNNIIQELADVNIKGYNIRINKKLNKAVINYMTNGYTRTLNIFKKTLKLKNKIINLNCINNLNDELKHLEIIIKLQFISCK